MFVSASQHLQMLSTSLDQTHGLVYGKEVVIFKGKTSIEGRASLHIAET